MGSIKVECPDMALWWGVGAWRGPYVRSRLRAAYVICTLSSVLVRC